MQRKVMGAALAAVLIAVSVLTLSPASSGAATNPQEGEHDVVVNTNPLDTTPHILDGNTQAVVDLGSKVIVGGKFTQVKRWNQPTVFTRNNIFAYDKATGAIDTTFVPQLDGQVTAMLQAADGKVFVSRPVQTVNGVAGGFLVKLDPVTGVSGHDASTPQPNGMVYDIHLHGGTFTSAAPSPSSATSSAPTSHGERRRPVSADRRTDVALHHRGHRLHPGHAPRRLARRHRRSSRSATSPRWGASTGRTSPSSTSAAPRPRSATWFTDGYRYGVCSSSYDTYIRDIDFSPDGSYFVVVFDRRLPGPALPLRHRRPLGDRTATGTVTPTWTDYTGGDTLSAVAVTGAAMYVAGHQRWANNAIPSGGDRKGPGGVDRVGIAALDAESGVPLSWNPGRERGITVWRMVPTADGPVRHERQPAHVRGRVAPPPHLPPRPRAAWRRPRRSRRRSRPSWPTRRLGRTGSPASGQLRSTGYDGTTLRHRDHADRRHELVVRWPASSSAPTAPTGSSPTARPGQPGRHHLDPRAELAEPEQHPGRRVRAGARLGRGRLLYRINNDRQPLRTGLHRGERAPELARHTVSGPGRRRQRLDRHQQPHGDRRQAVPRPHRRHAPAHRPRRRPSGDGHDRDRQRPTVGGLNWANTVALHTRGQAAPPPPPPRRTTSTRTTSTTSTGGPHCRASRSTPPPAPPPAPRRPRLGDVNGTKAFARQALGVLVPGDLQRGLGPGQPPHHVDRADAAAHRRQPGRRRGSSPAPTARSTSGRTWRAQQTASPVRLTIGSWARLELCATAGPAGTLTLAVDGSPVDLVHREHGDRRLRLGGDRRGRQQQLVRQLRRPGGRRAPRRAANSDIPSGWARWPMAGNNHDA